VDGELLADECDPEPLMKAVCSRQSEHDSRASVRKYWSVGRVFICARYPTQHMVGENRSSAHRYLS
jgi:hypothetical protein